MKSSTASDTTTRKTILIFTCVLLLLLGVTVCSLLLGKYPITLSGLLHGDSMQVKVFTTLRLPRSLVAVLGGFCLGVTGFVFQTVFRNPLASPDIIGVASGAGAGAAAGILFLSGSFAVTMSAFGGALVAVFLALGLSSLDRNGTGKTIVLAGIAVHALSQTALMSLKLVADPEKELASIEYWLMGSLNGIDLKSSIFGLILGPLCVLLLFFLHRQIILLSTDEAEAKLLGVNVTFLRILILLIATLSVASVICMTGLISFVGLLAPHIARKILKHNRISTMWLSGLLGSLLLCGADLPARGIASHELPISIFTSLIGAPFLIWLIVRDRRAL